MYSYESHANIWCHHAKSVTNLDWFNFEQFFHEFIHLSVCDMQNGRFDVSSIIKRMLISEIKTADSVIMNQTHSQINIFMFQWDIFCQ